MIAHLILAPGLTTKLISSCSVQFESALMYATPALDEKCVRVFHLTTTVDKSHTNGVSMLRVVAHSSSALIGCVYSTRSLHTMADLAQHVPIHDSCLTW